MKIQPPSSRLRVDDRGLAVPPVEQLFEGRHGTEFDHTAGLSRAFSAEPEAG